MQKVESLSLKFLACFSLFQLPLTSPLALGGYLKPTYLANDRARFQHSVFCSAFQRFSVSAFYMKPLAENFSLVFTSFNFLSLNVFSSTTVSLLHFLLAMPLPLPYRRGEGRGRGVRSRALSVLWPPDLLPQIQNQTSSTIEIAYRHLTVSNAIYR